MSLSIFKKKKPSKFKNKIVTCLSRHVHDSKFEAEYCNKLLAMKKNNEILNFQTQWKFPLSVHEIHICDHIVDFIVTKNDMSTEVHETKGFKTPEWRLKRKLFMAIHPTIQYVTISRR